MHVFIRGWQGAALASIAFAVFIACVDTGIPSWVFYLVGVAGGWLARSDAD